MEEAKEKFDYEENVVGPRRVSFVITRVPHKSAALGTNIHTHIYTPGMLVCYVEQIIALFLISYSTYVGEITAYEKWTVYVVHKYVKPEGSQGPGRKLV